jgi:CRP/FNR family transcriptional regulator, polysaccharide utilization system transcription regulator
MSHYSSPYIEQLLESSASVFNDLNTKDKEMIAHHITISRIKRKGLLFSEGEKTRGPLYLASGKAKVYRVGVGGREHILRMLTSGDVTGFHLLFSENIWNASSIAVEECITCTIEKHNLLKVLRNNAELSLRVTQMISNELSYSYNKMVSLTQKHVRGRLVESLLMLVAIYGYEADGRTINICLSRTDIAHLSNMTSSNAIRTLSNLAAEGNIKIKGRKITILNYQNLERISEQA